MSQLAIIKEYIDAKADYDQAALSGVGRYIPESLLTEPQRQICQRYKAAESALNEAMEVERDLRRTEHT